MITQQGANVHVAGIRGNFDDAQTGVKEIFEDSGFKPEGVFLSSANSINIGRLLPQIVYYFYSYGNMVKNGYVKLGEGVNFTVPTGNFGNILAGWYAKKLGLPINKLICASNSNRVLYDFFSTRTYDRDRPLELTASPSMDILLSSNLERLIYHLSGSRKCSDIMKQLKRDKMFVYDDSPDDFVGVYADDTECFSAIASLYNSSGYIMDTHTAVGFACYEKYKATTNDDTANIILSTASPYKFLNAVMGAIDKKYISWDNISLINEMSKLIGKPAPKQISELYDKPILHREVIDKEYMKAFVFGCM